MKFDLSSAPDRIRSLPISDRGYPVPFFVSWFDGKPEFRAVDPLAKAKCVSGELCWICGQKLGRHKAFVAGPLFAVNQQSVEPPSHRECAIFATQICPFMILPKMARRSFESIQDFVTVEAPVMPDNPGATIVWMTSKFTTVRQGGGYIFVADTPSEVLWYAEGILASRRSAQDALDASVERAIASHPALASNQRAKRDFSEMAKEAYKYLPQ